MSRPRLVPWCSWDEWSEARECFFDTSCIGNNINSNAEQLQRGVALVDMWRLRGHVPHACDSTAQLVEVSLTCGRARLSQSELRLIYSMIITRAVNGLVDVGQLSYFADSVLNLASRIGLPSWLVELRHESTHQQLPSLTVLRMGCECLLRWYKDNYWDRQIAHLHDLSTSCVPLIDAPGAQPQLDNRFIDNLLTHKTYFSDVFAPLFYEANINQAALCGAFSKRKSKKWLAQQHEVWGVVLAGLKRTGAYYIAALILHLAVSATDLVTDSSAPRSSAPRSSAGRLGAQASYVAACSSNSEGESGDEGDEEEAVMNWKISSLTFWMDKLLVSLSGDISDGCGVDSIHAGVVASSDSAASLQLVAGMMWTLLRRVEDLSRPRRQVLAPTCAVLVAAVKICGGDSDSSSSSDKSSKRQREEGDEEVGCGAIRMVASPQWPLGTPAGCFGNGRLTEVEEVQGAGGSGRRF